MPDLAGELLRRRDEKGRRGTLATVLSSLSISERVLSLLTCSQLLLRPAKPDHPIEVLISRGFHASSI